MIAMTLNLPEVTPTKLAAILYRGEDDVDTLLADFASDRLRAGEHLGGIVQRNIRDSNGCKIDMQLIDLMNGIEIGICQSLGTGSQSCKLNISGLAEASVAVTHAIESEVDLLIINKFAKQEATGHGLRSEFAEAIMAGRPVLTAVPEKCLEAWIDFTGDQCTMLLCAREAVDIWWQKLSAREAAARHGVQVWQDDRRDGRSKDRTGLRPHA
jgi:molybdate transport system ATP-binding protein